MEPKLQGNNAIGGRFGTSIAAAGDLNQDGYQGALKEYYEIVGESRPLSAFFPTHADFFTEMHFYSWN